MAEFISSAIDPSEGLPSEGLASTSVEIVSSSQALFTSDAASASATSSEPPAGTGISSTQFDFGIQPVSSSLLPDPYIIPDIVSFPPVSSAAIPSDDPGDPTTEIVTTSESALGTSTISSIPNPSFIPSPLPRGSHNGDFTSSASSSQTSITTSSVGLDAGLFSGPPEGDEPSSSPAVSPDVNLLVEDTTSQRHVTVTLTSPGPSTSSQRPVATSNPPSSTSSSTTVQTISKINSSAQAPVSAGSASASAGDAHADGSKEGLETKSGQTNLSSFAIVGIVGGILVAFVIVYLIWYRWRRNKTRKALGDSPTDSTFQGNEKPRDEDRNSVSSFGDGVDPFDDSRSEYTTYPSDRYHEDRRHPRKEYDEWDGHTQLWDERGTRTKCLEGDDADIEAELAGESMSGAYVLTSSPNPFDVSPMPPVPSPPPANSVPEDQAGSRSLKKQPARPSTKASDPFGYDRSTKASLPISADGYDSLYEKYDHSRPGSDYDRRATLQTPATAALVPWMRQHRQVQPNVPPVPAVPPSQSKVTTKGSARRDQNEVRNIPEARRVAPIAAMAQTPIGHVHGQGWTGVIPPFR